MAREIIYSLEQRMFAMMYQMPYQPVIEDEHDMERKSYLGQARAELEELTLMEMDLGGCPEEVSSLLNIQTRFVDCLLN